MRGLWSSYRGWCGLALAVMFLGPGEDRSAAAAEPRWEAGVMQPVPAGARVRLEAGRSEFFLGENVLIHFILENVGSQPFEMAFGGDYRGASRALRFKVTATDEAGRVAEDPDPSPLNFGGLGGTRTLKPGERFVQSLPLMRYAQLERPGRYKIVATHDFGWKAGPLPHPTGELTLTFRLPDAAQAEQVLAQMEKLPTDPSTRFGEKARDYADFSCLRAPAYVGPLVRRAQAGVPYALAGLEQIPTPEATAALIQLAGAADPKVARAAALSLTGRLPAAAPAKGAWTGGPFGEAAVVRRRLAARAFTPRLVPPVRALASRLLAGKEPTELALGAAMIQAVGDKDDAALVLAALDRALGAPVVNRHDPRDNILDLPAPIPELLRALKELRGRGYKPAEGLSGEAQLLFYFESLAGTPPPRPPRFAQLVETFAVNASFPVREAALRSIPEPVPPFALPLIPKALEDPDHGVSRAACTLARKLGDRSLLKPLLALLATERHPWLLREASDAARELGAGSELLATWADRLGDEDLYELALDNLQAVIEGLPGGSSGRSDLSRSERLALRAKWKEFLSRHAAELQKGRRFKLTDPALSPALFGRARSWQLPDGTTWPRTAADK